MSPELRVAIALKVLAALRENVARAGGQYSGSMAPNFQSVEDVLALPDEVLERELAFHLAERFRPTPAQEAAIAAAWRGWPDPLNPAAAAKAKNPD